MKGRAILVCLGMGVLLWKASFAPAGYLTIYGGPAYDPNTGNGFKQTFFYNCYVNSAGTVWGSSNKYAVGKNPGTRAVRWDASGSGTVELGNLGTRSDEYTYATLSAINGADQAVGHAYKYVDGNSKGQRAVRWDGPGTTTELGILGTDGNGNSSASAHGINNSGIIVGSAAKYVDGNYKGNRPVRWDGSGTATELGHLGTDANGRTSAYASKINDAGVVIGMAGKYFNGYDIGSRAVRWEPSGTVAMELGNLGTDTYGQTYTFANAINNSGTIVGEVQKYIGGDDKGTRAVRWEPSGTVATELGNLGTASSGTTHAGATATNDAGTAVGGADKYVGGVNKGTRAVRWDALGIAATELGNLGTDSNGVADDYAYAINASGTIVGEAEKYIAGSLVDYRYHAVFWGLDGLAIDLNNLIDPSSGWTLTYATSISDTGWVSGEGYFDPDGPGGFSAYKRLFLVQIPEPATLALLALGGLAVLRKRRGG